MNSSLIIRWLAAASIFAIPVSAQQMFEIPGSKWASDITSDGQIVAGPTTVPGNSYIWRWRVDPAPTVIPGGLITAISDDGSVAAGCIFDSVIGAEVAAIWTAADGWTSLGWLPNALNCPSRSNAYDISADGTTVIGLSWDGCSGRGFKWTAANGMEELEVLGFAGNRASAISDDGSTIGGFANGTSGRTPAFWSAGDNTGQVVNINAQGEVYGFNSDGSKSVGSAFFSGTTLTGFIRESTGALTNLGSLDSNWASNAWDISEDGKTVPGFDNLQGNRKAWIWRESDGLVSVADRAANGGFPTTLLPWVALNCSDDGNLVIGGHFNLTAGDTGGYIFEFETPLRRDVDQISLSAGGSQALSINFGDQHAGDVYWVFGSATGTSPGLNFGGPILPLNFDGYFNLTLTRPNAGIFSNFIGMLNGQGEATAGLSIPAASDPSLAGVVLQHAVTVSEMLGTIDATSNAVSVTLGS